MLLDQIEGDRKKQKTTETTSFKDEKHYVESEKTQKSIWADGEKNFLEDVTMNLMPDDDDPKKSIKG